MKTVRKARHLRGLTQEQAAAAIGVTPEYITMLESGARPVTPALAAKLGPALGVSADVLLEGERTLAQLRTAAGKAQKAMQSRALTDAREALEALVELAEDPRAPADVRQTAAKTAGSLAQVVKREGSDMDMKAAKKQLTGLNALAGSQLEGAVRSVLGSLEAQTDEFLLEVAQEAGAEVVAAIETGVKLGRAVHGSDELEQMATRLAERFQGILSFDLGLATAPAGKRRDALGRSRPGPEDSEAGSTRGPVITTARGEQYQRDALGRSRRVKRDG